MAHQYTTMVLGWINVVNNVQPCRCSANGIQRRPDVVMLSGIWKEHLDAHWDHRHNTHILWKTIHGLSNRARHTLSTSITFNNKIATTPKHIANCFNKQFTNTIKHTKQTYTLTEQHTTYKDTTSHSLLLRSKRL